MRSPLRVIDGFSNMLEEDHGPQLDDDARRMRGVIRRNAQHMSHLISSKSPDGGRTANSDTR